MNSYTEKLVSIGSQPLGDSPPHFSQMNFLAFCPRKMDF